MISSATMKPGTGIVFGIVTSITVTLSSSSSLSSSPVSLSSLYFLAFGLKGRRPRELVVGAAFFKAA